MTPGEARPGSIQEAAQVPDPQTAPRLPPRMRPWQFQSLQVENVSQTQPDPSPTVCWAGQLPLRPLAVPSVQRAKDGGCPSEGQGEPWEGALRSRSERRLPTYTWDAESTPPSTRTKQEAPSNLKFTAFLGTPGELGSQGPCRCTCERRQCEYPPTWGRGPRRGLG